MLLLPACSDETDGPDNGSEPVKVRLHVRSSEPNNAPDQDSHDITLPNENIHTWWAVIVDYHNKVVASVSGNPGEDNANGVTQDTSDIIEIKPGHYSVYAFANVSMDDVKAATEIDFNSTTLPSWEDLRYVKWKSGQPSEFNNWERTRNIPMSGFTTIDVSQSNQDVTVEVIRMVAKITFQFTSRLSEDVWIRGFHLSPYDYSASRLFPDYDLLGYYRTHT